MIRAFLLLLCSSFFYSSVDAQLLYTPKWYGLSLDKLRVTDYCKIPSDTLNYKEGIARIGTVIYAGNGNYWTSQFGSGGSQSLQDVTDVGSTTTNAMTVIKADDNIAISVNGTDTQTKIDMGNSVDNAGYMNFHNSSDVETIGFDGQSGNITAKNATLNNLASGASTDSIVVRNPSTGKFYQINRNSFLTNATGLITAGTNVTITGSGTAASPYVISSTGGGGGTDSAIWKNNGFYSANQALNLNGKKQFFINGQVKADTVVIGITDTLTQDITIGGTSIEYGYYSTDTVGIYRYTTRLAKALGLTEVNNAVPGLMASGYVLSNTPTYGSTHKYLLFSFGTNEVVNNVDTNTAKTNFQSIITNALGKGWPASRIVIVSNWYIIPATNAYTTLAKQTAMLTMIRNLATANGCIFVDMYSTELANIVNTPLADFAHPTNDGHALAFKKVLNTIGYTPRVNGQSLTVQGLTDLSNVRIAMTDTVIAAQTDPVGYDFKINRFVQLRPNFFIRDNDSSLTAQTGSINVSKSVKANTLISRNAIIGGDNSGWVNSGQNPGVNIATISGVGYIQQTATYGVSGNLNLQFSGGNVAIGNVTPTAKLHVAGGIIATGSIVSTGFGGISLSGGLNSSTALCMGVIGVGVYAINSYDATNPHLSLNSNAAGNVIIGSSANVSSAVLNIVSSTKGLLIPRLTTSGISLISSPANGLLAYNRDSSKINIYDSVAARWAIIPKVLTNTTTLDFGNTVAGAATDLTVTVTGAQDGDPVAIGVVNASVPANGSFRAWVSATNTVTVRFVNNDLTTAYDPASGVFKVSVFK